MALTREHILWAAALLVEKHYGSGGSRYIAERIGDLVLEDDVAGVEMWLRISRCFETLQQRTSSL